MALAIAVALLGVLWITFIHLRHYRIRRKLPPGPPALPIIGNLHMLGDRPHVALGRLAQKYGPIMSVWLGQVPTVVATSPEAAELIYKTHDAVFAGRPQLQVGEYFSYGHRAMALTEYGPHWRSVRRLCTLSLLTAAKVESFAAMRREEMGLFVDRLREAAAAGVATDVSERVVEVIENVACRMIIGRKKDERFDLKRVVDDMIHLVGVPNIGDLIPFLRPFDLQGVTRRIKKNTKEFDKILEIIINENMQGHDDKKGEERSKGFVDDLVSMMGQPIDPAGNDSDDIMDRSTIKAILKDLLSASIDTSSITINWIMAELMRNPRVMKKLQDELKAVIGLDRMVEEADLAKLAYLDMVIKEGFRLHTPGPLLVPHECLQDISINGYLILKKSRVLVNIWAMGLDKKVWTDNAEEFYPERFKDHDTDIRGHDFRLLPFGSGRRGCPGSRFGLLNVQYILAQMMHCFNWELPPGMLPSDVDMSGKTGGLSVPRAHHLVAFPKYRLKCN